MLLISGNWNKFNDIALFEFLKIDATEIYVFCSTRMCRFFSEKHAGGIVLENDGRFRLGKTQVVEKHSQKADFLCATRSADKFSLCCRERDQSLSLQ